MQYLETDISVVGGGIVGGAVALALADAGFEIVVLEPKPPEYKDGSDYGLRVSAISHTSSDFLRELKVWDLIAATRISPYRKMHIWEEGSKSEVNFDSAELQKPDLGNIVENELIRHALFKRLESLSNVKIISEHNIIWSDFSPTTANIALDSDKVLKSRLVVGADGALSSARDWVGIEVTENHTGHFAVVANVKPQNSHQQTAWQKFLRSGPLAFLPLANADCSIVWSTDKAEADELVTMNEDEFLNSINTIIKDSPLSPIIAAGNRVSFPLVERHAKDYYQHNLVLVGDAAHTIHPLAGQGVNLGLADAKALVGVLATNKTVPGQEYVLADYARQRRLANWLMLQSMRGFRELFASSNKVVAALRSTGMNLFDSSYLAKQLAMKQATG